MLYVLVGWGWVRAAVGPTCISWSLCLNFPPPFFSFPMHPLLTFFPVQTGDIRYQGKASKKVTLHPQYINVLCLHRLSKTWKPGLGRVCPEFETLWRFPTLTRVVVLYYTLGSLSEDISRENIAPCLRLAVTCRSYTAKCHHVELVYLQG